MVCLEKERTINEILQLLLSALGIKFNDEKALTLISKLTTIPKSRLKYYNRFNVVPSGNDLERLMEHISISEAELMVKMGHLNKDLLLALQKNSDKVYSIISSELEMKKSSKKKPHKIVFQTPLGKLYRGDCIQVLKDIGNDSVDLVFADPPFNLNKLYPSKIDDNLKTEQYIHWCQDWLKECIRVLKLGGALFIWNLPIWNAALSSFLEGRLRFKHWIGVDIKYRLPIKGRLYPSHYSLLYFIKGEKANTFQPDRLPMQICPHCAGDLKDYGGYKDKMNPKGVNLSDIWYDIPPVRHKKYKKRNNANELSIKLMDRIIEMASKENDIVLDPFGGSGTTYVVAELKNRKWIGCEIGPENDIVNRFDAIENEKIYLNNNRKDLNLLFSDEMRSKRIKAGLWTCESVRKKKSKKDQQSLFKE